MELANLELGQCWKAKDDVFIIVKTEYPNVSFQSRASGLIFSTTYQQFRKNTQFLVSAPFGGFDFNVPWEEGDLFNTVDLGKFILLRNIRKKIRAYSVETGVDYSIGEILEMGAWRTQIQREVNQPSQVICLGKIWNVQRLDKHSIWAGSIDEDRGVSLDYKACGMFGEFSIVNEIDMEEVRDVVAMSEPLPNYGHLKFWEKFAEEKETEYMGETA